MAHDILAYTPRHPQEVCTRIRQHKYMINWPCMKWCKPNTKLQSVKIFRREMIDALSLLAFKSEVLEDAKGVLASWNETTPICQWTGVSCGRKHQRVTALNLRKMRLSGIIPPHVGNLSFLRLLDLSDNSFHSVIPPEVGQLIRLRELNLSYNFFSGEVPKTLGLCDGLVNLILDHNLLEKQIPPELGSLTKLEMLYLKNNNLTGSIPATIGNLTSLQELYISYNDLEGQVPDTMAKLSSLKVLGTSWNRFTGEFPPALYNISTLKLLSLSFNNFSGSLRPDIGLFFPNLQRLYLGDNYFHGSIPASLSNCSGLLQLDFPTNNFSGNVPSGFGSLRNLLWLNVGSNQLGSGASDDLDFISSLSNCQNLQFLDIEDNKFGGMLPSSLTNLSNSITRLIVGNNMIYGRIPEEISNLVNLEVLFIRQTIINSSIPDSIGKLSNLKWLALTSNKLEGQIPYSLGNIRGLLYLDLHNNSLEGSIPGSLANCTLQELHLSINKLTGGIPKEILNLSSLTAILNLSTNSLSGSLPDQFENLTDLAALDLSGNKFSGTIPSSLGNCVSLEFLYMQGNSFDGEIPALANLKNIRFLDLSHNNLSGHIPHSIAKLSSIQKLDLSFNSLEGEVPTEGVFQNASSIQVSGNGRLCGGIEGLHLPPCPIQPSEKPHKHITLKVILIIILVPLCSTLILLMLLPFWLKNRTKKPRVGSSLEREYSKVSYDDLLKATGGFSSHNLIGTGNFGTVYKGTLGANTRVVAIKVLKLQQKGASSSFLAECQALRNIRHRNLVKVLTACSSVDFNGDDFKALIYDYLPNGSLEKWLHPVDNDVSHLSISQRMNIAVDVASALHYLHHQCQNPVVHCDLKPSNILLGNDLTAHVSDFGLARLLMHPSQRVEVNQFSSIGIRGTIGYAAPEYGMGGPVSTQGDVYSFGVLLLEMFTGRRPTDEMFKENLSLHSFVQRALPDQVIDIVDQSVLYEQDLGEKVETSRRMSGYWREEVQKCLTSIFRIGVACSVQAPQERLNMRQVAADLISIRDDFCTCVQQKEVAKSG